MSETGIVKETLLRLSRLPMRVWRNNTGQAWMGRAVTLSPGQRITAQAGDVLIRGARPVRFGLPGSGDILGLAAPDGRFLSIECKTLTGDQAEQQGRFQAMVERHGGIYVLVRDPSEAAELVTRALKAAHVPV